MTEEQPWLREQLYEINVMLKTLLTLASLDSDIRLVGAALAAPPSEADSADVTDEEQAGVATTGSAG